MAAAIQLDIGGNTARLDRDIQKTVNKAYTINLKTKGEQPLGRITGKVNEFNKSLDASNARVIAFGASAGIIFGVQRAFDALVASTINVQKSLAEINVILNVSTKELASFGGELFKIAKNTGQSFDEVAKAATEFSRQGLGVAETLKRTNEALILSRLSGLDAAKSVQALTAAVNSFASQAVTATEIVNKFATVDAAFAVSSADLADAISRVGSSASQSGVSLNELIAIVTSAQQTTARGGAVIGNSFKTIFTRLQREKVVDLLESLGISKTDSSGQLKSTIQLLQDLAGVYDKLGATQQAAVAEQVGGVFQINILKAALADLGKEYSIYNSALNVAAGATDQAIRRNEELNKTYASQLNALQENAKQLAATAGQRLIGPTFERVVGGANQILGGINESDGQGIGAILGKGILDGLGQLLAGPGLALIGGVLLKLFKDFGKFATGSIKELLGLNTATKQQADLQKSINQILSKNPQLL
jgi:TP901 family phage tail tape measure protein